MTDDELRVLIDTQERETVERKREYNEPDKSARAELIKDMHCTSELHMRQVRDTYFSE